MYERGELGRWFRELRLGFQERPNPGTDAERKRNGAAGEAVTEAVALGVKEIQSWPWRSSRWGFSC